MNRFIKTAGIAMMCMALLTPTAPARDRGRHDSSGKNQPTTAPAGQPSRRPSTPARPGNQGRPSGNNNPRPSTPGKPAGHQPSPGSGSSRPSTTRPSTPRPSTPRPSTPGNSGPSHTVRPGNHDNGKPRPGLTRPGTGHPAPPASRPVTNRPQQRPPQQRPVHRPSAPRPGHPMPAVRPYLPPPRPYHRPVPPPNYVPVHHFPVFRTILNVAIGTAFNTSLNYWLNNGYSVVSYGDNVINLGNVTQLGYNWPDATLYFSSGSLAGSEFIYSTPGYDKSRYNNVYVVLSRQYGAPASMESLSGSGETTRWWGSAGQYISLSYYPATAVDGTLRYYTTLSFGN